MITIRYSTEDDLDSIKTLIESRFGVRDDAYTNLNNRYILLFNDKKLICMTGCNISALYKGYEIDWTCVDKNEEGKGAKMWDSLSIELLIICTFWVVFLYYFYTNN